MYLETEWMLSKSGIFSFDLKAGCSMSRFSVLLKGGLFFGVLVRVLFVCFVSKKIVVTGI